jgi:DNA-binding NtrC family response regulator
VLRSENNYLLQIQEAIGFGKLIPDCYTYLMNQATPILICNANEDFRSYLREMLSKHGFFHVLEASTAEEALSLFSSEKGFYALVNPSILTQDVMGQLIQLKNRYLVIAQSDKEETFNLSVKLGVENFLSFPFSSRKLVEKMTRV